MILCTAYTLYAAVVLTPHLHPQVFDFYKQPNVVPNNVKDALVEVSDALDSRGIQMLGQTKRGSCHQRAILFKFLTDAVGIDSTLLAVSFILLDRQSPALWFL